MESYDTLIIGAGLAGISAGLHLKRDHLILEAADRAGGLCVSNTRSGYTFDITGHWLHLRDPEMKALSESLMEMPQVGRVSKIFSFDRLTEYPFQANLKGLPEEVIAECVYGAAAAHRDVARGELPPAANFAEHVLRHFGEGIARHFMFPYNTKLWGADPRDISFAWCQRFVPVPDLRQIIYGAFTDANRTMGYNALHSYPARGGIGEFTRVLAEQTPGIELGARVTAWNAAERWVELESGLRLGFKHLISTMPLRELVRCRVDGEPEFKAAGEKLRCTRLRYLDLGVRAKVLDGNQWLYLPDPELSIYRIGCYSNAMPSMAPEGCSSLYVEIRTDREVSYEQVKSDTLKVLSQIGPTVTWDQVEVCDLREIPYAYVVYDHQYEAARNLIMAELEEKNIISTGRYGKWVYASMEDALLDGRAAAQAIEED